MSDALALAFVDASSFFVSVVAMVQENKWNAHLNP
jgi:hypothetical protein